jgi:hypothetical protein
MPAQVAIFSVLLFSIYWIFLGNENVLYSVEKTLQWILFLVFFECIIYSLFYIIEENDGREIDND